MLLKKFAVLNRAARPVIEALEDRRLLSATLSVENLDGLPFNDRLIFNRIQNPDTTLTNVVHDQATVRLSNTGDTTLTLNTLSLNGPWKVPGFVSIADLNGTAIAPGAFFDLTLQFIQDSLPPHSVNETNYTTNPNGGASITGALTISTNDSSNPNETITLAGYWQNQSEHNNEPNLTTISSLLAGFGTVISDPYLVDLTQPSTSTPTYYGDEVVSQNWAAADPTQQVSVRQLAGFHTQGNVVRTYWYSAGSQVSHLLFSSLAAQGQTLFPTFANGSALQSSFTPTGDFGLRIDNEYSDDAINVSKGSNSGAGHHVRFYPLRDRSGDYIPNTFLVGMDYAVLQTINFDFNDNVYIVSNLRPATAPPTPSGLTSSHTPTTVTLNWSAVNYSSLQGYNIYRRQSTNDDFVKVNSAPVTGTTFTDDTATSGVSLFYQIRAVDSSTGKESVPASITAASPSGPITNPDTFNAVAGVPTQVNVIANDTDSTGTILPGSVTLQTAPSHGTASVNSSTGLITYTANAGFGGDDTFTYKVTDSNSEQSAAATITFHVTNNDTAKPESGDDSATVLANHPETINVLANDSSVSPIDVTTVTIVSGSSHGTAVANADGTATYTPNANFVGGDSFTYTVRADNGQTSLPATVRVNVGVSIGTAVGQPRKLIFSVPDVTVGPATQAVVTLSRGTADVFFSGNGTVSTSGKTVTVTGSNLAASGIVLTGTNRSSTLKISRTGGNDPININAISSGSMGQVIAPTIDLGGNSSFGSLKKLQVQDIGNALIQIGAVDSSKLTLIARDVSDTILSTSNPVAVIKAASWTNTEHGSQSITAPSIASLSIKGNFDPDLILTSSGTSLSSAKIGGTVSTGFWELAGRANSISVGLVNSGWGAVIGGALASFKVAAGGLPADIQADAISSLNITGNLTGNITAAKVASLKVSGNVAGSTLTLTGPASGTTALSSLSVKGSVSDSTINATGNISSLNVVGDFDGSVIARKISSFKVGGNLNDSTVRLTGPTTGLVALSSLGVKGSIIDSVINASGDISSVVAGALTGSVITAGSNPSLPLSDVDSSNVGTKKISSIKLTGKTGNTFSNSQIIAQTISSASLGTVDTTQTAGVAGDVLKSVKFAIGATKISAGAASLADQATFDAFIATKFPGVTFGDFQIRII